MSSVNFFSENKKKWGEYIHPQPFIKRRKRVEGDKMVFLCIPPPPPGTTPGYMGIGPLVPLTRV